MNDSVRATIAVLVEAVMKVLTGESSRTTSRAKEFWNVAIASTGIAGIGTFVFWSLYREWLRLPIFSRLSPNHTFVIMLVFLGVTFLSVLAMLVTHIRLRSSKPDGDDKEPNQEIGMVTEISWRLSKMEETFRVLEDGMRGTRQMTFQDHWALSDYVDSLFAGKESLYGRYACEKTEALLMMLRGKKPRTSLEEVAESLEQLRRSHRESRNYGEIIERLENMKTRIQQ